MHFVWCIFSGPPLKESSVRNLKICLCLASVAWSLLTYLNCSLFNNNLMNKLGKHPCVFLRSQGEGLDVFSMNSPLFILPPSSLRPRLGQPLRCSRSASCRGPGRTAVLCGSLWGTYGDKRSTYCMLDSCVCNCTSVFSISENPGVHSKEEQGVAS